MGWVALFPDAPQELAGAIQDRHRATFGSQLETVNRIPNPRPNEFVKIMGVGGTRRDRVTDVPTLAVEAWSDSRSRAAQLAQEVRAIIWSLEGTSVAGYAVSEVDEFAGPADLPDPLSNQFRYSGTYAVAIRTETIINVI